LGFKIAIDDFGTGFSSLAYLKHFSIDYLKIDITFIENIEDNQNDRDIIKAIAMIARGIGAKTIIEGVERQSQYEIVQELGIDYAQGFLFYRPMLSQSFFGQIVKDRV
jgi:EAL domain-containing protein (putative c-di-GMP-specific phosphodiesterase class I)